MSNRLKVYQQTHPAAYYSDDHYVHKHKREFHRRPIHNPKIYHPKYMDNSPRSSYLSSNDEYMSTPRNHILNDTFTLPYKNQQYQHNKILPKLVVNTNPKRRVKTRKKPSEKHPTKPIDRLCHKNFKPVLQPIKREEPIKEIKKASKSTSSTQTPRYTRPTKRHQESIDKFVKRNRHFHEQEDQQRIRQYVSNSLTQLPRVFFPRLDLYLRNYNSLRDAKHGNSGHQRSKQHEGGSVYDNPLVLHGNKSRSNHDNEHFEHHHHHHGSSSSELSSSDDNSDCSSVVDCIHYEHTNDREQYVNQYHQHHQHHHHLQNHHGHQSYRYKPVKVPHKKKKSPLLDSISHIRVLKSPLLWGHEGRDEKVHPQTEDDKNDADWFYEPDNSFLDDEMTNLNLNEAPQTNGNSSFDFWRDDDNFNVNGENDWMKDSANQNGEKKVRFN